MNHPISPPHPLLTRSPAPVQPPPVLPGQRPPPLYHLHPPPLALTALPRGKAKPRTRPVAIPLCCFGSPAPRAPGRPLLLPPRLLVHRANPSTWPGPPSGLARSPAPVGRGELPPLSRPIPCCSSFLLPRGKMPTPPHQPTRPLPFGQTKKPALGPVFRTPAAPSPVAARPRRADLVTVSRHRPERQHQGRAPPARRHPP